MKSKYKKDFEHKYLSNHGRFQEEMQPKSK